MELSVLDLHLRQRDGVSCGPAVAVVACALLDPGYRATLTGPVGPAWFAWEQGRVHRAANRVWPRSLGLTPAGLARVISAHGIGVRYRWRPIRRTVWADVERAVASHRPVALLVGNVIPRHWVLIVDVVGETWHCYEPSSGEVRAVARADVLGAGLTGLGYPRPFAVVLPTGPMYERARSNI